MVISDVASTASAPTQPPLRWFHSAAGRRYGLEIAALVVLKIVLLTLLWTLCIRPALRVHATPDAVARHLVPPPPAPAHD